MIPALIVLAVLALLFVVYVILLKPRPEPKTSVEPLKVDYAHRGLWGKNEAVENTLPAFEQADEFGYGIELDVQLSSDGEIVVFHDDTLERLCGRPERVDSLTSSELSWVDIHGTYEKIPLFEDVLNRIDHRIPLIIELKGLDTTLCEKVALILDHYDGYFSIESFNPFLLNWFRINRPRYVRGQLTTNLFRSNRKAPFVAKFCISTMFFNFLAKPDYISYDIKYPKALPVVICDKLYHAMTAVWTVEDRETFKEQKAAGRIVIFQKCEPLEEYASKVRREKLR
ncbi:MAG: glycerophosphodiester phosphodiesterase [Clostridia bacterium]|nr:glycerophosphodiester phosphodiesterase [Clostridia bacterium]